MRNSSCVTSAGEVVRVFQTHISELVPTCHNSNPEEMCMHDRIDSQLRKFPDGIVDDESYA